MIKKLILLASIFLLAACNSPGYYSNANAQMGYAAQQQAYASQAQLDAQQTLQNQYTSQAACMIAFSYPGDCTYVGGVWLSPYYYPWGAVIHYNHAISYGQVVPGYGGLHVHVGYPVAVNYSYASGYIASRRTYYVSHPTAVTTYHTTAANRSRAYNNTAPINRATAPQVSRINFGSNRPASRPQVSHVSWGSSSRSSYSHSSYSSHSSSYHSSGRRH